MSIIVTVAVSVVLSIKTRLLPETFDICTLKVSFNSMRSSSLIVTLKFTVFSPCGIMSGVLLKPQ